MTSLFHTLASNNTAYPSIYNDRIIWTYGQANIYLTQGTKSPDYSLYDLPKGSNEVESTPTLACEVASSESETKLHLDAARLICLSRALILLVIAVKITYQPNSSPRKLLRVTWSHWEPDFRSFKKVEDTQGVVVNDPKPVLSEKVKGGFPSPFEAYVDVGGDIYRIVARVTKQYTVKHAI
jgi:hypothetical protein